MEVRDSIYSFELARRAVGRAAFHLGLDSMSEAALDVLADVLLNYLNRVGRSLSYLTEASGRTSAHVNLLDALQACELTASPAIERLFVKSGDGEDQLFATSPGASGPNATELMSSDWKGLATFLFGPNWLEEKEGEQEAPQVSTAEGGKQGPSSVADKPANNSKKVGWNAPYLDKVPAYPLASTECANPHSLPSNAYLSLHRKLDEHIEEVVRVQTEELEQIPDEIFNAWGNLSKRNAKDTQQEDPDAMDVSPPPTKRVRLNEPEETIEPAAATVAEIDQEESDENTASELVARLGIPPFFPPPPTAKPQVAEGKTVVDVSQPPRIQADFQNSQSVRTSLVQLGNYWGSNWEAASSKTEKNLAVPLGRGEGREQQPSSALVVPLGRASGSRVSRILEGSMDAAAMH